MFNIPSSRGSRRCACHTQERFAAEAEVGHHRFQWLPFGAGPRMCLGAGFAQVRCSTESQYPMIIWHS